MLEQVYTFVYTRLSGVLLSVVSASRIARLALSKFDTCQQAIMPNCPKCEKPVYFAERKTSLGKDWHAGCLRCEKCNKTLVPGSHAEHEGKPYCNHPCYSALFGPGGFGRGGAESYVYKK